MLYGAGFAHMAPGQTIPVLPFFNLVMVWNPGISYGLFPASGPAGHAGCWWLFRLAAVAVSGLACCGAPPAGPWPSAMA